MRYPRWVSWAGLAAIIGGAIAVVLTPPFAIAYFIAYPGFDVLPSRVSALRPTLAVFLSFDTPVEVYNLYGRVYDVVYVLLMPAAFALHHLHRHAKARLEKCGFGILVVALTATFIGVAGDYWLGGAGFFIEMLGLLTLAAGGRCAVVWKRHTTGKAPGWLRMPARSTRQKRLHSEGIRHDLHNS